MLGTTDLKIMTPSVFATKPWHNVSENYRFVPTIEVVEALFSRGFVATSARQGRSRMIDKANYTKHVIRFRHKDQIYADDYLGVPEIMLLNSHDRSSAYKIFMGWYRKVCSNGMVAFDPSLGFTVRHSGQKGLVQQVIDASFKIIEAAPVVAQQTKGWSNIVLPMKKQIAYASAARELYDSPLKVPPEQLLMARRGVDGQNEDGSRDLWTTFNVVQENMIKGGVVGQSERTQSFRRTRAIKNINDDLKLNRALWRLTEELAKAS